MSLCDLSRLRSLDFATANIVAVTGSSTLPHRAFMTIGGIERAVASHRL